jgi:parvulin-like peptidyl-prolyl isomerase
MFIVFTLNIQAETVDGIEVIVNDSFISMQDLNYEVNKLAISEGRLTGFEPYSILLSDLLRESKVQKELSKKGFMLEILIAQKLIEQEAKKSGIEISDYEIQKLKKSIIERNNTDEKAFENALTQQGLTMSTFEVLLKKRSIVEKIKQEKVFPKISISDLEIENYYKINYKAKYKYGLAYIYIKEDSSFNEEQKTSVKEKIAKIEEELKTKDFGEVATEYTEGPYKATGGRLGFVKEGIFNEELENAIKELAVKEYTKPIKTDNGYHIFKLLEKEKDESGNYESKKQEIYQILTYQKWHKVFFSWLQSLKRKAYIDYKSKNDTYGKDFNWNNWYSQLKSNN